MAAMQTQWRVVASAAGPFVFTGLDYAALTPALRACKGVPHAQPFELLMQQLRVMELAARPHMRL